MFTLFRVISLLLSTPSQAQDLPWRVTLYGGIATRQKNTTEIFLHDQFHPDGYQLGLAVDRDLFKLGSGFTIVGEAGVTRFVTKSSETTINLGLGLRYDFEIQNVPFAFSGFTGPSWADDAPVIATGTWQGTPINFQRSPWLNYVGAELAIPLVTGWNAALRYYHRSGAFGLFAPNADEGSTFGVGMQKRF